MCATTVGCSRQLSGFVDLRTDFRPAVEFDQVRIELPRADFTTSHPASDSEDYLRGVRVAEAEGLTPGLYEVRAHLLLRSTLVIERRVLVQVSDNAAVTLVISRSCGGVACADDESCLGGRCVARECLRGDEAVCGAAQCSDDSDCPPSAVACASPVCTSNVCLVRADDSQCPAMQACFPDDGCVPLTDTDAGLASDAGTGETCPRQRVLAVGYAHACAIDQNNRLKCWGANSNGQSGQPLSTASVPEPTAVRPDLLFADIGLGDNHSCALTCSGEVYCWGADMAGARGDGPPIDSPPSPDLVRVGSDLILSRLQSGQRSNHGLTSAGIRWAWGRAGAGQLGLGDNTDRDAPAEGGSMSWTQVDGGEDHACGISATELYCWGSEAEGQLGQGGSSPNRRLPALVPGGGEWTQVSAGGNFTCGIQRPGDLHCWGRNAEGQLGLADMMNRDVPTPVGSDSWLSVSAGDQQTCAIRDDRLIFCWGDNSAGQLGDGSTSPRDIPTAVSSALPFEEVAVGDLFACALSVDASTETIHCWGRGALGQLGNGGTDRQTAPTPALWP